ncbi:MAG: deoxyribose-phosphate aldolase [Clostridia bacterium]|nr:deoxyribose-phosphate aldolase [Clostridia bacterium]
MELNNRIDHTLLKSNATVTDIEQLASEALTYNFYSVCVNPYFVELAKHYLKDSNIKIACVVGFPLGANSIETKVFEAKQAKQDGADEIDLVMNIGAFKSQNYDYVQREIDEVCDSVNLPVKVIVETSELTREELKIACDIVNKSKATFIKTSTGFSSSGANVEDIKFMRKHIIKGKQIKASGGIKDKETALKMLEAGADRLGTSSSVKIVSE